MEKYLFIRCLPIVFCFLLTEINCSAVEISSRIYNLCGQHNGRRIYLESGRTGLITARNVELLPLLNLAEVPDSKQVFVEKHVAPQECKIEFVACPSCVINWKILDTNFSSADCQINPRDDRIELTEPPYSMDVSGKSLCSGYINGETRTRDLMIRFIFSRNYDFAFDMEIEIKRNQIILKGEPINNDVVATTGHPDLEISTPFFPLLYPRDYEVEYNIRCMTVECQVHVNFIDFHVAPATVLEIIDYDGERFEIFTGLTLRPRIFLSKGNSVLIRFNGNGGIGTGFNAKISFLASNHVSDLIWNPKTDCGGYVDRLGGAITMMKMARNETDYQFFDCIWIIRPSNKFFHLKTHESLKVASYSVLQKNSQLIVRRGMTSKGDILGQFSESKGEANDNFLATIEDGFYIQLRGNFSHKSSLALVYTVVSFADCRMGSDFFCANQRCIPVQVQCDGFDHCGDSSDEPTSCAAQRELEPYDRQWYKFNPNYYFPGAEYDLKAASILFISTSAGLVAVIACLFIVLYRINIRARHHRELQNHLQTISELLDQTNRPPNEPEDEPPLYEGPPEYEEIIKVGMDKEMRRSNRRNREEHRRRRSKQPILEPEPEEEPTETLSFSNTHSILMDPFPIEASTSAEEAAEIEEPPPPCQTVPEDIDYCPEDESGNPLSNGFLIVFQNDEPTAVPVHEFIPFEKTMPLINTCLRCEKSKQHENKFANRPIRRFSADSLIHNSSPGDVDITRSFRV